MAYNDGRIYVDTSTNPDTGVSIGDLQQCFHTVIQGTVNGQEVKRLSSDLGVICAKSVGMSFTDNDVSWTVITRNEIKMLSRYKPIKDTLNGQSPTPLALTDTDFANRNWGFDIPTVNPTTLQDFRDFINGVVNGSGYLWNTIPVHNPDEERSIGNGWLYKRITIGTNWCRLTDFNEYNHNADDTYVNNTLTAHDSIKLITKKDATKYNPTFIFNMSPYSPRNFRSLENHRLGIAIYSPDVSSSQNDPVIYFYIDTTPISFSASASGQMLLTLPTDKFQALLDNTITITTNNVDTEATFYCVGFFVPAAYSGKTNLGGQDKAQSLQGIRPVPGIGYDTFQWQYVSGSGDLDLCLLAMNATQTSTLQVNGTGFNAKLLSITNNYDLTNETSAGVIIFYPAYLKYTYDILDSNNNIVYSVSTRAAFGSNTGSINVSNTEKDANNNVIHKTTDVSSNNITGYIPVPRSYAQNNYKVKVYLWYLTYNSVIGTDEIYRQCGRFVVPIGGVLPRD